MSTKTGHKKARLTMSEPTRDGFIALYSDYLSLRARIPRGRITRNDLVAHAQRLGEAILRDAQELELVLQCSEREAKEKAS